MWRRNTGCGEPRSHLRWQAGRLRALPVSVSPPSEPRPSPQDCFEHRTPPSPLRRLVLQHPVGAFLHLGCPQVWPIYVFYPLPCGHWPRTTQDESAGCPAGPLCGERPPPREESQPRGAMPWFQSLEVAVWVLPCFASSGFPQTPFWSLSWVSDTQIRHPD